MVVAPIDGIKMHVFQHVMHPTHIPLEGKTKPTNIGRTRHKRPCCRFFRHCDGSWLLSIDRFIELTEKINRLQVFSSAILVSNPLSWLWIAQTIILGVVGPLMLLLPSVVVPVWPWRVSSSRPLAASHLTR